MPSAHCSIWASRMLQWALAWLLLGSAQAGTVYRCGNVYQDAPCAGAQAVTVDDERSVQQQRQREQDVAAERRLADNLAAERQRREKALRPQTEAVGIGVRRDEASDATPTAESDNPCDKTQGRKTARKKKTAVKCRNGQPVYVAVPAVAPR